MSNTTDTTAARLASLLVELLNHPQRAEILETAALEAHHDSGAEARHTGDLLMLVGHLGRHLADAAEADCLELAGFYEDEARFPSSDHKPGDCRKWATEYGEASAAYERAALTFTNLTNALDDDLRASGI